MTLFSRIHKKSISLVSLFSDNKFLTLHTCPALCKKCPYSELFRSAFFPHFPAFGLNTRENADQNKSQYGHLLRSAEHGIYKETKLFMISAALPPTKVINWSFLRKIQEDSLLEFPAMEHWVVKKLLIIMTFFKKIILTVTFKRNIQGFFLPFKMFLGTTKISLE